MLGSRRSFIYWSIARVTGAREAGGGDALHAGQHEAVAGSKLGVTVGVEAMIPADVAELGPNGGGRDPTAGQASEPAINGEESQPYGMGVQLRCWQPNRDTELGAEIAPLPPRDPVLSPGGLGEGPLL